MGLHQAGDLSGAIRLYEELLAQSPDNPSLLHFLGMARIQLTADSVEGEANVRRALAIDPDYADAWNSLGNLYRLTGRSDEALAAYERVTDLHPDSVPGWLNLGDLCESTHNVSGARRALERVVALLECGAAASPETLQRVLTALAGFKSLSGHWAEATELYGRALHLDPANGQLHCDLIHACEQSGDHGRAVGLARLWLQQAPDDPAPQRLIAILTGTDTAERVPDEAVALLFDDAAAKFDQHLAKLNYRAPSLLLAAVAALLGEPGSRLTVCDAGCGTGLCAAWLRPYARNLAGVDLSQGMLNLARERGLYDELAHAELTAWLARHPDTLDLLVSADTLCYFGNLRELFAVAHASLHPGGLIAFTVELETARHADGYHLQLHDRYRHDADYVRRCLHDAGFRDIRLEPATLREELLQPVAGLVVTASRPSTEPARIG